MNQINVDDNLKVTFTAAEIAQVINHLSKGTFEFVAMPIEFLNARILEAHNNSKAPSGGGIAGAIADDKK